MDLEAEVSVNDEQQQEEIRNGRDTYHPDEHQPGSWPILATERRKINLYTWME
jgi:hypothetical protein